MNTDERPDEIHASLGELLERSRQLQEEVERHSEDNRLLQARLEAIAAGVSIKYEPKDRPPGSGADVGTETVRKPLEGDVLSRRQMLGLAGMGIVAGTVAASVIAPGSADGAVPARAGVPPFSPTTPSPVSSATLVSSSTATVIVRPPTGIASTDTGNILAALSQATHGTSVLLQCASTKAPYVINQELPIPPGVRLTAEGANNEITAAGAPDPATVPGGLMATLQQEPKTSLRCVVGSAAYLAGLYGPANPGKYPTYNALYNNGTPTDTPDSAIEIDHIAFDGQNGGSAEPGNTNGHAIVLFSAGSEVHDCFIFDTAQVGVVISDANYAGTAGTGSLDGNRIYDNTVFNCGEQAVVVTNTSGSSGCHNGYLLNNNIEAPSRDMASITSGPTIDPGTGLPYEAVRMENAAGWWVANNHPYQVPGNGWYVANIWGLHFVDNSTDDYGSYPIDGATFVGYDFYFSAPTESTPPVLSPALIDGNQISGYEGFNTNNHNAGSGNRSPNATNTFLYYRITMALACQQNPEPATYVAHANNSAHQDSQPATPISGAKVTAGSSTVTFGSNVTTSLQVGMSVADSAGCIPANTYIGEVSGDSISLVSGSGSAVKATGSNEDDTISFPAPGSTGWTYVNEVPGSTLVVYRTNELISPTVGETPSTSGGVVIFDPANFAGGLPVSGTPEPGQTIVATSATAATWGAPPAAVLSGQAGGVLSGKYPNPSFAPTLTTTITAAGKYTIPPSANYLRITCVGGGGGGGGGGTATATVAQAGGAGGAAGTSSTQVVSVGGNTTLSVTVGAGGTGGPGGSAGGNNAGSAGGTGGDTTVSGAGIFVRGSGGVGGKGGGGGSTTVVHGAPYGGHSGTTTADTGGGCGGGSGSAGGFPIGASPGGGGGGGSALNGLGGDGGGAGSAINSGKAGGAGANTQTSGATGGTASDWGGPGGGGGGGTNGAAGGAGGNGAAGFVIVEVIG